eukprot:13822370-Alexandrium_andersonii.AAC.1
MSRIQAAGSTNIWMYRAVLADYRALDVSTTQKLRSMLRGRAWGGERSWPSLDVWRCWKLAPSRIEIAISRVSFLRAMVDDPEAHARAV